MKVFISWSGERSRKVALALRDWLPDVIQSIEPWVSEHDINAGSRWGADLDRELAVSNYGILVLTKENKEKPWLLFEAGSLAKAIDIASVVPYRLNLSSSEVRPPLSQFQGVDATKEGTFKLLQGINSSINDSLPGERLIRLFEKMWPDLKAILNICISEKTDENIPERDSIDYLKEILELVRKQSNPSPRTQTPEQTLKQVYFILNKLYGATEEEVDDFINVCERGYDDTGDEGAKRGEEIGRFWKNLKWG